VDFPICTCSRFYPSFGTEISISTIKPDPMTAIPFSVPGFFRALPMHSFYRQFLKEREFKLDLTFPMHGFYGEENLMNSYIHHKQKRISRGKQPVE